jgi:anti-sigma factor RsiW
MTSSEPPTSPEEKWTAYLDGKLSAQDAAAFEREHPEAAAERAMHARLMSAVRMHSPAPQLRNADFFNARILREISPRPAVAPKPERTLWSLWRLAFASACCLVVTGAIYALFVRGHEGKEKPDRYVAEVVSVKPGDDLLAATVLDADGLAIVWIDGLDQLPNDYVLE